MPAAPSMTHDFPSVPRSGTQAGPLVVGFGEALIRLATTGFSPLEYASHLDVEVGGAELNTLIAASQLGCRSRWVSRLPENPFGRRIAGHARRHGVDADIIWEPDGRIGLYFIEQGVAPRHTQVIYDRLDSSASHMAPGQFEWHRILEGASALHCSGITCALGSAGADAVLEVMETACELGIVVSFDLNYRSRLWTSEAAAATFQRVLPFVDLLFASPHDLHLLGGDEQVPAEKLVQAHGLGALVIRSQRETQDGRLRVEVTATDGTFSVVGAADAVVVDAFGAGDVAAAAFLSRYLVEAPMEEAVTAAAQASAYMYTIPGDTWIRPNTALGQDGPSHRIVR